MPALRPFSARGPIGKPESRSGWRERRRVELIPDAEGPARLVVQIDRLLAGLDALGVERSFAWAVVQKTALDSMPSLRRATLDALYEVEGPQSHEQVATAVGYPVTTTHRALEDLAAHRIVVRTKGSSRKADLWALAEDARALYQAARCVPEKKDGAWSGRVPEKEDGEKEKRLSLSPSLNEISGIRTSIADTGDAA